MTSPLIAFLAVMLLGVAAFTFAVIANARVTKRIEAERKRCAPSVSALGESK